MAVRSDILLTVVSINPVFDNKLMKLTYKIQTSIYWSKFMFFTSWMYVCLTLFEPTHIKDVNMQRWDDEFRGLFYCELSILLLFFLDFTMSFYHNFYERKFKDLKHFNIESQIVTDADNIQEEIAKTQSMPKRNTLVGRLSALKFSINVPPVPPKKPSNIATPSSRNFFVRTGFIKTLKIFFCTFLEQGLIYKFLILSFFGIDYSMYFALYPHNYYRISRFARTLPFAIFSKATKRTLQAVYHSVKRIFDFFIFFFSIVFLYALLGSKIFYDDGRTYYTSDFYDQYINDYNNYGIIVNSLIVLVTFDNYPLVMRPFVEMSLWYLVYFIPYIMLNILFFIPVPIAVVYDGFREKRSKLTVEDHLKEKEALFTCYLSLTEGQSRSLGLPDLEKLLNYTYTGNLMREQIRQIFQQMDVNGKGKFSINDFLGLTDILNSDPSLIAFDMEFKFWGKIKAFLNQKLKIKAIVAHFSFEVIMLVVILLNSSRLVLTQLSLS
jgi:Ion transport protein